MGTGQIMCFIELRANSHLFGQTGMFVKLHSLKGKIETWKKLGKYGCVVVFFFHFRMWHNSMYVYAVLK